MITKPDYSASGDERSGLLDSNNHASIDIAPQTQLRRVVTPLHVRSLQPLLAHGHIIMSMTTMTNQQTPMFFCGKRQTFNFSG